ncbi:MAG: hypothetical protein K2P32_01455, partial [Clostridia bacterium]|nr:hypothetical protein [Clostridia bacterium]
TTASAILRCLVGAEMCLRDRPWRAFDIPRLLNVGIAADPYGDLANFNVLQDKSNVLRKQENKPVKK